MHCGCLLLHCHTSTMKFSRQTFLLLLFSFLRYCYLFYQLDSILFLSYQFLSLFLSRFMHLACSFYHFYETLILLLGLAWEYFCVSSHFISLFFITQFLSLFYKELSLISFQDISFSCFNASFHCCFSFLK